MIIKQQIYQIKCDHCDKVSPSQPIDTDRVEKLPEGWMRTNMSDECSRVFLIDYAGRQMACVEGAKHFCCISCFYNSITKQIDNYMNLVQAKATT